MTNIYDQKNWTYDLFGKEGKSREIREKTVESLVAQDQDYNHSSVVESFLMGTGKGIAAGIVEGMISSFAVPMSLRKIKDRFPQNVLDVVDPQIGISEKVDRFAFHATRIPSRIGLMGWGLYDVIVDQNYAILATNILSLGWLLKALL